MTGNPLILREKRSTARSSTFSVDASFLLLFRPVSGCCGSKMGAVRARCVRLLGDECATGRNAWRRLMLSTAETSSASAETRVPRGRRCGNDSASSRPDNGNFSMLLARRAHGDLHVLPEMSQELHQALDRKHPRPVAHQRRDVRLLDAKDCSSPGLGEAAVFDDPVYLQREARLQQLLLGMRQVEIGKDIAAPLLRPDSLVFPHAQFCLSL